MRKRIMTAVAVVLVLSLVGGLVAMVVRSIEWRTKAHQTLTSERERFSHQERLFMARLDSVSDTVASLTRQIATAKDRQSRATGQLSLLRDSLSLASQLEDSLDIALDVIDLQDFSLAAQEEQITGYVLKDQAQAAGLLLAKARSDSQSNRIASLEATLRSAPLLQQSRRRKLFGIVPHPGDGWLILGTVVATLTIREIAF